MDTEIKEVSFNGDKLLAVRERGSDKVYVGVRWVCQGLGFNKGGYDHQVQKIQGDPVLSQGACKNNLLTNGGNQEVLCIELDYLPLWLAKINANILKDVQTKEKLVQYQLRAKDVLANAFVKDNTQAHNSRFIIPQTHSEALRLAASFLERLEVAEPKAEQYDTFMNASGVQNMNNVAKSLDMGRNRLMKHLRNIGIFMSDNTPYQCYINRGFFRAKQRTIMGKICVQPFATAKGINFIAEVVK